jgi:DNA-binding transcriptional LysR family regulator
LSRQIKALEDELGWTLIERGARSIALTREGEAVAKEGRVIVREVEAGIARMREAVEGAVLRIGYAPSLAKGFLGTALDRFSQCHPNARVSLYDLTTLEMEEGIAKGTLEIMVGPKNEKAVGIRWELLRQDEWRLAIPKRHALAQREVVKASDLDGQRLLLYSQADYPEYWARVTGFFEEQGINAKVAGEFDGGASLMAGLEGGMGVALIAAASGIGESELVVSRRIEPSPGALCVAAGVSASRGLSPLGEVFLKELQLAGGGL